MKSQFIRSLIFDATEFLKHPGYVISTLLFPGLFFVVFAAPNIEDRDSALLFATSFAAFGILGVVFFQYAIALIDQKSSGWEALRRTLPMSSAQRFAVKMTIFGVFGLLTGALVLVLAQLTTPIQIGLGQAFSILILAITTSLPFLFLGGILAHRLSPLSALPIMNMVYLLLSFSGGLWLPPDSLPDWLQIFSEWLPTRHWGEVLWAHAQDRSLPLASLGYIVAMSVVLGPLLYREIRHFENEHYS